MSDRSECYGEVTCQGRLDSKIERIRQEEVRCQTNAIGQECKVEFEGHIETRELDKCVRQLYREELSDRIECYGEDTCQGRLDSSFNRILQEEVRRCQTNAIDQKCKVEFEGHIECRELDECVRQSYREELSDKSECYGEVTCQGQLDSNVEKICQEEVRRCQSNAIDQECKVEFDKF